MEFRIADTFTDSLARLTGDEQKAVKTTAFDLQINVANPGMNFHKLDKAKDKNFWSVRVNSDIRLIVHKTSGSLLLCYVAHHDQAYDWARRRKLETHPRTGSAQLVEIRETTKEILVPTFVEPKKADRSSAKKPIFAHLSDDVLLGYGVPTEWLHDVRVATEDTLFVLADHLPREASEALLELATGGTPRPSQPADSTTDPFEHPDARRRFRVMGNVEELQRALDYPWEKWTVFLHPEQRQLVERDYAGPVRISGSAGTGKTIVALHRAVFLARKNPDSRVLLTTFSDTLASALRTRLNRLVSNEPRLAERLDVYSLNGIGLRLYKSLIGAANLAAREDIAELLREAAAGVSGHKFGQQFLLTEWEQIVDAWQLDNWESYRDVARLGRKTRLQEAQRKILWSIIDRVRAALTSRNLITHASLFTNLAGAIAKTTRPPFDFVVVDEAQDISIAHLKFCAAMGAGRPNALFFAGDLGQRIFQQPFSWKSLGVDIRGRSRTLHVNYRTSHQIRMQADKLLGPEMSDVDGNSEVRGNTVSVFNGPPPTIQKLKTQQEEILSVSKWLLARAKSGVLPHEFGILVRSDAQLDRATAAAMAAGMPFKVLDERVEPMSGYLSIGTMPLAKGLEFRAVVVMACDDEIIPLQERIETVGDDADLQEVYNTERHLLYVACTRARDYLLLTSVHPASEFLDDLQVSTPNEISKPAPTNPPPVATLSGDTKSEPPTKPEERTRLFYATDLVNFLGCLHSTVLDLRGRSEPLERDKVSESVKLLQRKGQEHEIAHLQSIRKAGKTVAEIPKDRPPFECARLTREAMQMGVDVIYQAALLGQKWGGYADFLIKTDKPSRLGAFSYEAVDTKLARHAQVKHLIQLGVYSGLLAAVQGAMPEKVHIVLGDNNVASFPVSDFAAYVRHAMRRLEAFAASPPNNSYPEPCAHCATCHWNETCDAQWEKDDHLSLVANIQRSQTTKLVNAEVKTMVQLSVLPAATRIPDLNQQVFERLRSQASLQEYKRRTGEDKIELLQSEPGRGFARLPKPDPGDLFFDMEGDPLHPDGLEYLFGLCLGQEGKLVFRAFWAHDHEEERTTFGQFMEFLASHLTAYPEAYIYHYNHYETTALKRLACRYAVAEHQLDDLLRRMKFVDLYKAVREGIRVSESAYSLKNLETFYMAKREGDVATAGDSIVVYNQWRETRDDQLLQQISDYNEVDCISTAKLRDWLLTHRPQGTAWFDGPTPATDTERAGEKTAARVEREAEYADYQKRLLAAATGDSDYHRHLADLLEFHAREARPQWWAFFDRQNSFADELLDDTECLAGLTLTGPPAPVKRSLLFTFRFPPQETKRKAGEDVVDVATLLDAGTIEQIDDDKMIVKIKHSTKADPLPPQLTIGPGRPISSEPLRNAIYRFAKNVLAGSNGYLAVRDILSKALPRFNNRPSGETIARGGDLVAATIEAVADLNDSYLFIQGPPGAGKTYTSANVIVEMIRRGKKVGVAANSHKAIHNLLAMVESTADELGVTFRGIKKSSRDNPESVYSGQFIESEDSSNNISLDASLLAGSACGMPPKHVPGAVRVGTTDPAILWGGGRPTPCPGLVTIDTHAEGLAGLPLCADRACDTSTWPGETEAGSAGTQPDQGITWTRVCRKAIVTPRLAIPASGFFSSFRTPESCLENPTFTHPNTCPFTRTQNALPPHASAAFLPGGFAQTARTRMRPPG